MNRRTIGRLARGVLVAWLLVSGLLAAPLAPVLALARMRLNLSSTQVTVGQTFALEVRVEEVTNLSGLDITLTFDPNVLEVLDDDPAQDDVQIQQGSFLQAEVFNSVASENGLGLIFYEMMPSETTTPVSGSGTVAVIHFRAKSADADTIIDMLDASLLDAAGEELDLDLDLPSVQVNVTASSPTATETPTQVQQAIVVTNTPEGYPGPGMGEASSAQATPSVSTASQGTATLQGYPEPATLTESPLPATPTAMVTSAPLTATATWASYPSPAQPSGVLTPTTTVSVAVSRSPTGTAPAQTTLALTPTASASSSLMPTAPLTAPLATPDAVAGPVTGATPYQVNRPGPQPLISQESFFCLSFVLVLFTVALLLYLARQPGNIAAGD